MKITFYLISLFLFLLSCTEKEEKKYLTAKVQTITLGKSQRIPLSTIFDSLSYIKLDDKKEKKAKPEEKLAYNLFFTDKNGTIRDKFFYYNPLLDDVLGSSVFSYDPQNDRTYFHYAVYDTIYSFSPVGNKKYRIDFGENQLPLEKINKENFSYYLNKTGFAQLMDICCSDRCMFVNYSLNNKVHAFIYKLDTKEVKNISFLENDFDKTSFALAMPEKIIGNKVYFTKSANTLLENYQSDTVYINQKGKELCITSESNPVLVIGYLK